LEVVPVSAKHSRTPSYRPHKASGQAVVTLNGRDIYLGVHGTKQSRATYDRVIAEWLANGRREEPGGDLTVSQLVNRYLDHVEAMYQSNESQGTSDSLSGPSSGFTA
jgi:hypothetical protein